MKNPILVPELKDLLKRKRFKVIKSFFEDQHPRDSAEFIGFLQPEEIWKILGLLDKYTASEIFGYLDIDVQVSMASGKFKANLKTLVQEMSHDDRAYLFQHLDREVVNRLLLLLPAKDRADVIRLTSYREETCGAIMTTDYATLLITDTAEAAVRKIRRDAPGKETIYYIYVTDPRGVLLGIVSLRKLILAKPREPVGNLMKGDAIYALVDDDQEKAAHLIDEYDLLALPVVDAEHRIVGIITYDDAIDIIREEQTEDMEKLMAISGGPEEDEYLEVPVWVHFRKRVGWVVVLAALQFISGMIIEGFRETLQYLIILAYYMPLLNSAGGNTGSQSATMVIRAIALNQLSAKDIFHVIKKEFAVSLMIGLSVGTLVFARVMLAPTGHEGIPPQLWIGKIALMISLALAVQVIWATVLGALIPMAANRFKIDPAVVSSPAIATLVDIGGIAIYFATAKFMLGV